MSENVERSEQPNDDDELFEEIRNFLADQAGDDIYEDFRAAFSGAQSFVNRELRQMEEYGRMVRTLERLLEDEFPTAFNAGLRSRLAEMLYVYGLAHYSLLHQQSDAAETGNDDEDGENETARPLVIYDIWFPQDVAVEQAQDGYYLHISDGRIDLSLYLGEEPNERSALVDLVDHWGYAASNTPPSDPPEPSERITPVLTIELDYGGSEMVDADDHIDVLFLDNKGEPIVRMHARAAELRLIVDELQAIERDGGV